MYKLFILLTVLLFGAMHSNAQKVSPDASNNASALAGKIADKMRDSLQLSATQRAQINDINLQLSNQKQAVRSQSTDRNIVMASIQKIEGSRDSLYKSVLTESQFNLYRQKKRNLVSAN